MAHGGSFLAQTSPHTVCPGAQTIQHRRGLEVPLLVNMTEETARLPSVAVHHFPHCCSPRFEFPRHVLAHRVLESQRKHSLIFRHRREELHHAQQALRVFLHDGGQVAKIDEDPRLLVDVVVHPIHPLLDEFAHVLHCEFRAPRNVLVGQINLEECVVETVLSVLEQRYRYRLSVVRSVDDLSAAHFGEREELVEILALVFEPLTKLVVHASHLGERGDYDAVHPAPLHLLEDGLLVLYGVSAELSHRALSYGIVQNEEIQVAESVSFLLGYLVDIRAHLPRCVRHETHLCSFAQAEGLSGLFAGAFLYWFCSRECSKSVCFLKAHQSYKTTSS